MAHWTDDPKIHALMTHLGKVGKTGKPTRSAFAADQVNRLLVQVEARMAEHRKAAKEEQALSEELARLETFVKERAKRDRELREAITEAKQDLIRQNPNADTRHLDIDAQRAVDEFDEEKEQAVERIEELTKSVTMKRTTMRRIDDRVEHYRQQVYAAMKQVAQGNQPAA